MILYYHSSVAKDWNMCSRMLVNALYLIVFVACLENEGKGLCCCYETCHIAMNSTEGSQVIRKNPLLCLSS